MRMPPQKLKRALNDRYPKQRDSGHFLFDKNAIVTRLSPLFYCLPPENFIEME